MKEPMTENKAMEKNWEQNRKYLVYKGFVYMSENRLYWLESLKIEVSREALFVNPVVFFDCLENQISYRKTLMEIKKL